MVIHALHAIILTYAICANVIANDQCYLVFCDECEHTDSEHKGIFYFRYSTRVEFAILTI